MTVEMCFLALQHTVPLPMLILDKVVVWHRYPSKKVGVTVLMSVSVAYSVWYVTSTVETYFYNQIRFSFTIKFLNFPKF